MKKVVGFLGVILTICALIIWWVSAPQIDDTALFDGSGQLRTVEAALKRLHSDIGRYPTQEEGLGILFGSDGQLSKWRGPYLRPELKDWMLQEVAYEVVVRGSSLGYELKLKADTPLDDRD